jgi:hypothetical protein
MFGRKRRVRAEGELRQAIADMIDLAEGGPGMQVDSPLMLKPGERLAYSTTGVGLFEPRREPGHWAGRSAGLSIPVGKTGIRYRIGKSAGTYVQGAEKPTVIDRGDVSFTTQRVVFQGAKYTREWPYPKLIGIIHYSDHPATAIQVSNRQKTSGITYPGLAVDAVRLRLAVAVEVFNGESQEAARELRAQLAELDTAAKTSDRTDVPASPPSEVPEAVQEPASANTVPTEDADESTDGLPEGGSRAQPELVDATPNPPVPATGPAFVPATWGPDPSGRHELRFWDGKSWTEHVSDRGQQSKDPLTVGRAETPTTRDNQ